MTGSRLWGVESFFFRQDPLTSPASVMISCKARLNPPSPADPIFVSFLCFPSPAPPARVYTACHVWAVPAAAMPDPLPSL